MARERTGQGFDAWLTRATTSGIPELDRFALCPDGHDAVTVYQEASNVR